MDINIQLDAGDVTQGTDSAIRGLERIRSLINGLEPVGARLARDSRGELDGVLAKARTAVNQLHSDMGKLQRAMSSMDPKQLRETLQDANTKMTGLLTQVDKLRRTSWVGAGAEEAQRKIRALTTEVQVTVTEYGKMALAAASAPAAAATAAASTTARVTANARATSESVKEVKREIKELEQQTLRAAEGAKMLSAASVAAGQWRFNRASAAGAFREQSAATFVGPVMPDSVSRGRAAAAEKEQLALLKELQREEKALQDIRVAAARSANKVSDTLALREANVATRDATKYAKALADEKRRLDREAQAVAKSLQNQTGAAQDLHSAYRGLASGFGAMWLTWGRVLPLLAGAAVSHSLVGAVKAGAEMGQTLQTIGALGEVGAAGLERLNAAALEVGRSSTYGPREAAEALKSLALAGLTVEQQLAGLPAVLDFAKAGELPLKQAAEELVAVSTAFGMGADRFREVGDVITKTAAASMASATDMAAGFRTASSLATLYKVSLNDVALGLGLMAQAGIKGQAAGTGLRQMYVELTGATKKTQKALKEFGITIFDDVTNKVKSLPDIVRSVSQALEGMDFSSQMKALQDLTNERGMRALGVFLQTVATEANKSGQSVSDAMNHMVEEISRAQGFMGDAAKKMTDSTQGDLDQLASTIETQFVAAFQAAEPEVRALLQALREAFGDPQVMEAISAMISGSANLATQILSLASDTQPAAGAFKGMGEMIAEAGEIASRVITNIKILGIEIRGTLAQAAAFVSFNWGEIGKIKGVMEADQLAAAQQHTKYMEGLAKRQAEAKERVAGQKALQDIRKSDMALQAGASLDAFTAGMLKPQESPKPTRTYSGGGGGGGRGGRGGSKANPANDELRDLERLKATLKDLQEEYSLLAQFSGDVGKLTANEKALTLVKMQQASAVDATGRAYTAQEKSAQASKVKLLENIVAQEKANKVLTDQAEARKKLEESTKSWNQSMDQTIAGLEGQVAVQGKSKEAIEMATLARMKEAAATGESIKVGRDVIKVTEEEIKKQERKIALMQELNYLQMQSDVEKTIREADRANRQGEQSLRLLGMTNLERAKANALLQIQFKYEEQVYQLNKKLNKKPQEGGISPDRYDAARALLDKGRAAEESAAVNKVIREDFEATANSINSSLTDAFMRSMEDGKGFGSNMAKALKAEFKKLVLQPTISFIMQPISNMLGGLVQGLMSMVMGGGSGGIGGSGIGLGDLFGGASNGNSLLNLFTGTGGNWGAISGFAGGSMSFANMAGSVFANATGTGLSGLLATNGAYGTAAGAAGGAGSMSGLAGMAGGLAAVAIPLIVGAIVENNSRDRAGGAAFATSDWRKDPTVAPGGIDMNIATGQMPAFEDMVTRMQELGYGDDPAWLAQFKGNERAMYAMMRQMEARERGEYGEHQALPNAQDLIQMYGGFYQGQGYADPQSMGWWNWKDVDYASIDPKVIEASRKLSVSIVDTLTQTARALGQDADFRVTTGWANRGKGKLWGAAQIMRDGQEVAGFNRSDYKDTQHYMQAVFSSTMDAFKTFDLPEWANNLVDDTKKKIDALTGDKVGEEAAALYQQASQNIVATLNAIKTLIDVFPDFAGLTQDTVYAIGEAMGGIENLNSKYASYIQNFYSDQERADLARKQVSSAFEQAGLTMPATREEFRAMVEALDLTTEAGRTAFATMMGLADSFAQITADGNALMIAAFEGAQQLAGVIREGLLGNLSAQQVGEQMADIVVGGIYNAIAGGFANQITQMMMEGVITPMLQAAVAGTSITEAVSQAAIDKMIADATAAAQALGQLLNSEGFQTAMQGIQNAMLQMAPQITAPRLYYTSYAQRNEQAQAAAEAAQRARDEAQRAAQQAAEEAARKQKEIENERLGLLKTLLQMEGYQDALRKMELEALDPSNRALQERIWALQDAAEAEAKHTAALKEAQEFFGNFTKGINEFIFNTKMGQTQDAAESYRMAAGKFSAQMTLARGGDREALTGITGYASTLIDSIKRESSSSQEANLRIASVLGQLGELPRVLSAEELIVKAVEDMKNTLSGVLVSNFDMLDTTMDGALSFAELQASGLASDAQIRAMIARIDANGDGMISKTEAVRAQAALINTGVGSTNTAIGNNTIATNNWGATVNSSTTQGLRDVYGRVGDVDVSTLTGNNMLTNGGYTVADRMVLMSMNTTTLNSMITNMQRNVSPMYVRVTASQGDPVLTVRSENRNAGTAGYAVFAKGGVFTNGVVHGPTDFAMGRMGEAGSEAVMPLGRSTDGRLGVHVLGGQVSDADMALVAEMRAMREELRASRSDGRANNIALVRATKENKEATAKMLRVVEGWDREGTPVPRGQVKVEVAN